MNLPKVSALILGLGLCLTACGGGGDPTPPAPAFTVPDLPVQTNFAQPTAITGTVQGVGTIGPTAQIQSTSINPTRTVSVKTDGSFSLPLNANDTFTGEATPVSSLFNDTGSLTGSGGCSGEIAFSNPGVKVYSLNRLSYRASANPAGGGQDLSSGTVQGSTTGNSQSFSLMGNVWIYALGQSSARGTLVCAGGFVQANLQLKPGWNALTVSFDFRPKYRGTRYLSSDPKPVVFDSSQKF